MKNKPAIILGAIAVLLLCVTAILASEVAKTDAREAEVHARAEKTQKTLGANLATARTAAAAAVAARDTALAETKELRRQLETTRALHAEVSASSTNTIKTLRDQLDAAQHAAVELRRENETLKTRVSSIETDGKKAVEKQESQAREIDELRGEIAELNSQLAQERSTGNIRRIRELEADLKRLNDTDLGRQDALLKLRDQQIRELEAKIAALEKR